MKQLERWSLLVGVCLVCCGKVSNDLDPAGDGPGEGNAGTAGATAGGSPEVAGAPSAGEGGGVSSGGAPADPCDNDVAITMTPAECSALVEPPVLGGTLLEGTYSMTDYDFGRCYFRTYYETFRLTLTAPDTYLAEWVHWLTDRSPSRTNAILVTSGTTLTLSSACGETWQPHTYDYSSDSDSLFLIDANGNRRHYQRLAN